MPGARTLTPAESDILRPWVIDRMRSGGQIINYKWPPRP